MNIAEVRLIMDGRVYSSSYVEIEYGPGNRIVKIILHEAEEIAIEVPCETINPNMKLFSTQQPKELR